MTSEPATPQPSAPLPQDGHEGHHHTHRPDTTGKKLLLAMLMNVLIPAAQIVGGLHAHSMALISDAVHNLSDFTALLISYVAHRAGRRGPTLRHSFGLRY